MADESELPHTPLRTYVLTVVMAILFIVAIFRNPIFREIEVWRLTRDLEHGNIAAADKALAELSLRFHSRALPYFCRVIHRDDIWFNLEEEIVRYGPESAPFLKIILEDRRVPLDVRHRAISLLFLGERIDIVSTDDRVLWCLDMMGLPISSRNPRRFTGAEKVRESLKTVPPMLKNALLPHLEEFLASNEAKTHKRAAIWILRLHQQAPCETTRRLVDRLRDDPEPLVRLQARAALIRSGDKSILDRILPDLDSSDSVVATMAVVIVMEFRHAHALPRLHALLHGTRVDHGLILHAIESMGSPASLPELRMLSDRQDYDSHGIALALQARARLGDREAVQTLVGLLEDVNEDMHEKAVNALERICQTVTCPITSLLDFTLYGPIDAPLFRLRNRDGVQSLDQSCFHILEGDRLSLARRIWISWWMNGAGTIHWDQETGLWKPPPTGKY